LDLAVSAYENLLRQSGNYQDAEARLQNLKQKIEQAQHQEKLENEYAAGTSALRLRDWENAIIFFENVLALDSNFRDARKKLSQARRAFEREGAETLVARYYADGVTAMQRNDLGGALAAFEKVSKLNPNYRDVAGRMAEIEKALASAPKAVEQAAAPPVNLDSLYQMALAAEQRGEWKQAVLTWEEIHFHQPGYRDIKARLTEARTHLNQAVAAETAEPPGRASKTPIYLAGIIGAMVVLATIVLLPANHARWHLLRRNYAAAAAVYEKLVSHHPKRLKFYPPLADIYLLLGREDDRALKIYRTVLQLNLPSQNYDRINSIVAKRFLNERRTDTDAIEVLEKALKNEQQQKTQ
jgi:tetratricopeptide (TPR) repeat protein